METAVKRRILLGVTGGIAAYKVAELARLLQKNNVEVRVAMTEAATHFVGAVTFQALTGRPVALDAWDSGAANAMPHIELSRDADAIVVAPASADFLAKLANGLGDDLLSTTCLARSCPLLVAPAMNREMWDNPATQRNVERLRGDGVTILGPATGDQACGETGMGRLLEPDQLLEEILARFAPRRLAGLKVVVTAGPTFEAIDTVRGITNRSSGKMGYALAAEAALQGAAVTLVSGPTALAPPPGVDLVPVTSAAEMLAAVEANIAGADLFLAVAAVADYTPARPSARKIKKGDGTMRIDLEPTVDILARVAGRPDAPFCVGFAAESENLAEYAESKRRRKNVPMIVANLVQQAIGRDDNEVVIHDDAGRHPLPRAAKARVAAAILAHAAGLLKARPRRAAVRPLKKAS